MAKSVVTTESGISRDPVVWDMRNMDSRDVYDETQWNESMRSGDVILCDDGIAILCLAWPIMVFGHSKTLHQLDGDWPSVLLDMANLHEVPKVLAVMDGLMVAWAMATG